MPYYLTTDEMIERILTTIATGSKVQVVGTSESLRDVSSAVTCLLRVGHGRDAGCMFWDGRPSDVAVWVNVKEGAPRLVVQGVRPVNAVEVYDEVVWLIDSCDRPERDAIRSERLDVMVPPALAAMSVNELVRLIFAAVKKAATGY